MFLIHFIFIFFSFLAQPSLAEPLPNKNYFSTRGNKIINDQGLNVRFTGINWFGFETETQVVHGLWQRSYKQLLNVIKQSGFNLIRIPYSNDILKPNAMPTSIDYSANPDLKNLTSLQVLDKIIAEAGALGLKIILDRHRPDKFNQSALWYTTKVPESQWIADWVTLAKRYRQTPQVIAFDLHNEPHDDASWGSGGLSYDWRLAAERAGNAIHKEHPDLLIVVEGIQATNSGWYWWGGNLSEAGRYPVRLTIPNKVVYSPHDYPSTISDQFWFQSADYPLNLPDVWNQFWGYLVEDKIAPVLLGEFGTKLQTSSDKQWLKTLMPYLKKNNISFTFWCLNPNSNGTGGLLENDWVTVDTAKLTLIKEGM